jgi:hypothetical protein
MAKQAVNAKLDELAGKFPQFKTLFEGIKELSTFDKISVACHMSLHQAAKCQPDFDYHYDLIEKVLECFRQATIAETLMMLAKDPLNERQLVLAIAKCDENLRKVKPQIALLIEGLPKPKG